MNCKKYDGYELYYLFLPKSFHYWNTLLPQLLIKVAVIAGASKLYDAQCYFYATRCMVATCTFAKTVSKPHNYFLLKVQFKAKDSSLS